MSSPPVNTLYGKSAGQIPPFSLARRAAMPVDAYQFLKSGRKNKLKRELQRLRFQRRRPRWSSSFSLLCKNRDARLASRRPALRLTPPVRRRTLPRKENTNPNPQGTMSTLNPAQILTILWELRHELESLENDTRSEIVPGAQVEQDITSRMTIPLDARLSKLSLICRAMWSLMEQKLGVTEEDLLKRITEIDGKVTKPALQCPKCKNVVCRKFNRCLFCGYKVPNPDPFDEV
jgi:hypothetical protein